MANLISFVGAGVSVGDLDGNGLSDDLVYVDSRFDEVTVCPAPGTGSRFEPFLLRQNALPYDEGSTAPMGSLLGDFNEDGLLDILVYFWGRSPILYLHQENGNDGLCLASFAPGELVEPFEVWHTSCATQADLDADGHVDLVVGNYNPDNARTLDATDVDGEREVMMGSWGRATNGGKTRLMLWSGDRPPEPLFSEAKDVLPSEVACGWTFALGAADLDGDLKPEIYLVHDFGADRLLHNESSPGSLQFRVLQGKRTWTTPRSLTVGLDSFNGMGVDFADVNGDGHLDFIVSNITSDYGLHQSNLLFIHSQRNEMMRQGIAPFANCSEDYGLSRGGWTWDTKFADFDNDGVLELIQATGFMEGKVNRWPELHEMALANEELAKYPVIYPNLGVNDAASNREHNPFFVRLNGRYYDVANFLGDSFSEPMMSRGFAIADVDGDGRLDFAVANNWKDSYFFRNTAPDVGQFLGLHLRIPLVPRKENATLDQAPNEPTAGRYTVHPGHPTRDVPSMAAVGAQVTVRFRRGESEESLIGQVDGGSGHSGQRSPEVHFGLGQLSKDQSVTAAVRWRDRRGSQQECSINGLTPGWHTINLWDTDPER